MELIAAIDQFGCIGNSVDGKIPWNVPEDMEYFRKMTTGHIVVMGNATFRSLNSTPLKKRVNIVLSRNPPPPPPHTDENTDCLYFIDLANLETCISSIKRLDQKVFVIGGRQIYSVLFPSIDVVHLTVITHDAQKQGDVMFPEDILETLLDRNEFELKKCGIIQKSKMEPNTYEFLTFVRQVIQ